MKLKQNKEQEYSEYKAINSDGYGAGIVDYSERWAELMEARMENGETISEMAQSTSSEADVDGITGFMYGCAVSSLSNFWEYGEQLRRWSNKDLQIEDEGDRANESGGVLNPALFSIK